MKIGIDCRTIGDLAGVGVYTRELVKHLLPNDGHNQYVLFFHADFSAGKEYERANSKFSLLPDRRFKKFLPIIYSHFLVAKAMNREKADVCLFPANIIPLGYRGKAVLTVHDLAVYKMPELFPDKLIDFDRRLVVPSSLRRAGKIIAVSANTKRDIISIFDVSAEKIQTILEGALTVADKPDFQPQETEPYFLFLGTIEPRKNLMRLIKAYTNFVQADAWPGRLILAGRNGWKNAEIFEAIKFSNAKLRRPAIEYLDYVAEADKPKLYAQAMGFIYPSLYEGFGLPVVEAMSYGAPIVASNNSSLPEIVGDAGILIDPLIIDQITEALRLLANDRQLRRELSEAGCKKSREFSWDDAAKKTLAILESS